MYTIHAYRSRRIIGAHAGLPGELNTPKFHNTKSNFSAVGMDFVPVRIGDALILTRLWIWYLLPEMEYTEKDFIFVHIIV